MTLSSIKASKHINESMDVGGYQIFLGGCKLSARISYCSFRKFARVKRKTAQLVGLQPPTSSPPTLMNVNAKKLLLGSFLFTLCVSEFETKPSVQTRKLKGIHLYVLLIKSSATQTLYDIRIPVIMPFLSDHILSMKLIMQTGKATEWYKFDKLLYEVRKDLKNMAKLNCQCQKRNLKWVPCWTQRRRKNHKREQYNEDNKSRYLNH